VKQVSISNCSECPYYTEYRRCSHLTGGGLITPTIEPLYQIDPECPLDDKGEVLSIKRWPEISFLAICFTALLLLIGMLVKDVESCKVSDPQSIQEVKE